MREAMTGGLCKKVVKDEATVEEQRRLATRLELLATSSRQKVHVKVGERRQKLCCRPPRPSPSRRQPTRRWPSPQTAPHVTKYIAPNSPLGVCKAGVVFADVAALCGAA